MPFPPTVFPTYLASSLPFRRRKSSTDSTASTSSTASSSSTTPTAVSYLSGSTSHLRCSRCLSDLALSSQIISKGFTGRHGRAYLVAPSTPPQPASTTAHSKARADTAAATLPNLPNTYTHRAVPRQLVTGAHTVGDISCAQCGSVLGWKYVAAESEDQKYKVGKFILETKRICRSSLWEREDDDDDDDDDDYGDNNDEGLMSSPSRRRRRSSAMPPNEIAIPEAELEFDSQDEDECDALFAGQWTPQIAKAIRKDKEGRRRFAKLEE